ncbi:uncharacterized protein Tco025E_07891 [Trypanosoma conorhini]|uniref:Mitochondrial glycoprotein n=1 Tax=Trypanosoma conorhini TaxID=83891 RepID=A0A422NHK3_9TRYP|nr:uncharacterized protein Tco025E_07891 [Trypanosoma conorhini]RNF04945.1 hypothetical protein Tco025E_07891 [Trypanosoma conorhini]
MLGCRPGCTSILPWANNALRQYRRASLRLGSSSVIGAVSLTAAAREHGSLSDERSSSSSHGAQPTGDLCTSRHANSCEARLPFAGSDSYRGEEVAREQQCVAAGEHGDREQDELQLLRQSARTLRGATEAEIKAEVERDSRDGVAAVPPLPPSGWNVQHPAGSNYFVMTKTLCGGAKSAELHKRRYQSVHDSFLQAVKESQRQNMLRDQKRKQRQQQQQKRPREQQAQAQHRLAAISGGESLQATSLSQKMVVDYSGENQRRAMLREMETPHGAEVVERMDVHLTVFAPFRVYDPSLQDPTVDICEWSSFDVLVRKTTPADGRGSEGGTRSPLNSVAPFVEESALCMLVRLASVNSEMRIRFIQFLSRHEAQALEEHVCFGQGEPGFLELMRRRRQVGAATRPFRSLRRYDEPLAQLQEVPAGQKALAGNPLNLNSQQGACGTAYELLTGCFDSNGEYSRTLCYSGPYLSELSKEMMEVIQGYLQGDLAISTELCEYVCQMQYFLEQEEYMAWLGRLRHVATVAAERNSK